MNALKRAAEILREDAENIREGHTLGGDWQSEDKAKADHDEMVAVAEQLDALQSQTAPAVPEGLEFIFVHPGSGEKKSVFVTREEVSTHLPDRLYEMLAERVCQCQPVGELNFTDCDCEDYVEEFELEPAAPQPDHSPDAGKVVQEGAINEALESGGWWASCSGCHETNEGVCDGPRSIFGCHAGGGCDECGGIGVIWHEAPTDEQLALLSADPGTPATDGGQDAAYGLHHVSRMYQVMRTHDSTIDDVALDSMRDVLREALAVQKFTPAADGGEVEPPFVFDRYVNGIKMAQGVGIYQQPTLEAAMVKAAKIAEKGPNGEVPVLVYTHPAQPRNEVQAVTQFKDELVKSVKPIFRPHIEGVCAVVLDRLRSNGGDA